MRIADISNGIVVGVYICGDDWSTLFPNGVPSDVAKPGDHYDGEAFTSPPVAPPNASQLKTYAADKRWRVETGGLIVSGTSVRTDEKSQSKLSGAIQLLAADTSITAVDWEAQQGVWVTIDVATLTAIGVAVGRHVQACFSTLKAIQAEIEAGTITTFAEIEAAAWPSNGAV